MAESISGTRHIAMSIARRRPPRIKWNPSLLPRKIEVI